MRLQKLSDHVSLVTFSSPVRPLLQAQDLMHIEEGRPSRWRDGLARSFVHGSTHHFRKERGSKRLAQGALGPWALGVGLLSPRAPETVQVERRMA